jgi:hypothetical protein
MKTLKAITSDEMLSKVIERIESNDSRHDLHDLSQLACDYWEKQGYLVLTGMEGLKQVCAQYGADEGDADLRELNEEFLKACGFEQYRKPKHYYWGHNGDVTWLTNFSKGETSMRQALEAWVAQAWADHEEQLSWTE